MINMYIHNSDVMIGSIRHLGSASIIILMYSILLKTRINRDIFSRKLTLSIKRCIGSKQISKI